MRLRDYQAKAVKDLLRLLAKHRRVVGVAPTGSGKTVIGAGLVRAMKGKRVLWVAHRVELLRQALEQCVSAGIDPKAAGVISGGGEIVLESGITIGANSSAPLVVASVSSLRTRVVPECDLIVVDEAHRVMADSYRRVIAARPRAVLLGLTATPGRLDGKPLGDVFSEMLVMAESAELIADGYLAAPLVYGVPLEKAAEMVGGLATRGGDYSSADAERCAMRFLLGDVVAECARLASGRATIVFATTRRHAAELHRGFIESGRRFVYLDGDTEASVRAQMLRDLGSGAIDGIVNVDVLDEGIDCPAVKCVALARPTRSRVRFNQQCGRGSRPYGGERPLILDHAGNTWRFGLPHAPHNWSLDAAEKAARTGGGNVRRCSECGAMMSAGKQECPECGAAVEPTMREVEERAAKLELLAAVDDERSRALRRIQKIAEERGASEEWCLRVLAAMFGEAA